MIPKMIFASSLLKFLLMKDSFHHPIADLRFSTQKFSGIFGLSKKVKYRGLGIHLSSNTLIELPDPILHLNPLVIISLHRIRLLHTYKGQDPNLA